MNSDIVNATGARIGLSVSIAFFCGLVCSGKPDLRDAPTSLLKTYCVGCHGAEKQKGELRLDTLDPDVAQGKDAETWQLVLDQLNLGEMPPKKKDQPRDAERRALVDWLTEDLLLAAERKRKDVRVVIRRLTKAQYTHALQDLLQLDIDFGRDLPDDGLSVDGFTNNGEEQVISLLQTEYYMVIAERAMKKAIVTDKPTVAYRHRFIFGRDISKNKQEKVFKKKGVFEIPLEGKNHRVETFENRNPGAADSGFVANDFWKRSYADLRGAQSKRFSIEKDGVLLRPALPHLETGKVIWLSPAPSLKLQLKDFPTEGEFVLRVTVAKANAAEEADPYITALVGERLDHGHDYKTFEESVKVIGTRDQFQIIEFRGRLENFPIPIFDPGNKDQGTMLVVGVWNDCMATNKSVKEPSIIVKSLEFECGTFESWPPPSQQRIFIESKDSADEAKYSREIIQHFMTRAFRRPVTEDEVDAYHDLWKSLRPDCASFEQSIRETLASVLCSPHFLYLPEPATAGHTISEYQLASRLSFFLWNSIPDEHLLDLAEKNELRANLTGELDRMLKDQRSTRFVTNFCSEWLQMEKMAHTKVDKKKFPRFNRFVRHDMMKETRLFFAEVLGNNLSIMTLIDADFTLLNQNLAQFYGLNGVKGGHFRKVSLEDASRGGLLSHGLFLSGNSNGKEPHPIKRGAWLTSRILDDPPPPPPPNVPQIDEDDPDLAKLSIKEQLARHRENPSCADCHNKVDPWGLVFENYNAIGLWKKQEDDAAVATLPDGSTIDGVAALKAYIRSEKADQFTRGMVRSLLRYALGRSLSFADKAAIDDIVNQVKQDDKLQNVLAALISSPLFSSR